MVTEVPEVLICGCCGRGLRDTAEENVAHGEVPYPYDNGVGMCRSCGGDSTSKHTRRQLGWAGRAFYEARFDVLRENLSPENADMFEEMPYERKVRVIEKLIERGAMI